MATTLTVTVPSDREIALSREFDAPRELVFEALSKPEHLAHWWGRTDSSLPVCELDFRPGGRWRFVERSADGSEHAFRGEIREVVPPERIVQTFEYEGYPGHISVETMVLHDLGGRTRVTVTSVFDSVEDRDGMLQSGMEQGAGETYDRLAAYLTTLSLDRELVLSRVFDAPRTLVWRAWTEPQQLAQWFGPNGITISTSEMDVRPGGVWRFVMHAPNGVDYPNLAQFHEVEEPERLVFTHSSGEPGDDGFRTTVSFLDEAGKTRLTLRQLYATAAERDYAAREIHAIEMGNQTLDKLAAHLAKVAA